MGGGCGGGPVTPATTNGVAPSRSARDIFVRVLVACGYIFLLEGTVFGFSALRPLYVRAGVFADACAGGGGPAASGQPLCDEQAARLAALLTTGAAVADLVALPAGLAVWSIGRRLAYICAGALMATGFVALGVGGHFATAMSLAAQTAVMHGGFVIMAMGHSMLFNGTLMYCGELKQLPVPAAAALHPYATGMVSGSYAVATLTPLALAAMNTTVLSLYLTLAAVAATLLLFAVVSEPAAGGSMATRWHATRAAFMDAASRWRTARKPAVWVAWVWVSLSTITMNWYQATVVDQVAWFAGADTDATDALTTAFNVLLPLGGAVGNAAVTMLLPEPAPPVPTSAAPVTKVRSHSSSDDNSGDHDDGDGDGSHRELLLVRADAATTTAAAAAPALLRLPPSQPRRTAWRGIALAAVGAVVWGVPALIPNPWLQLAPMIVFSGWRTGVFVTYYHHVIEAFDPAAMLLLVNGASLLTGIIAFINVPLRDAVTTHGNELFTWITAAYVAICVATAVATLYVVARRRTAVVAVE